MKNLSLFAVLLYCFCISSACKKENPAVLTECLEAKLEEFKQSTNGTKIVRINRPSAKGGALYWLVNDISADEGEPVLDEQCNVLCMLDCKCTGGYLVYCDGSKINFPNEVIWER